FLHFFLITRLPATPMNPDDDRMVLALGGCIHVEHLPLILRLGVGNITVGLRLRSGKLGGQKQHKERNGVTHGSLQRVGLVLITLILPRGQGQRWAAPFSSPRSRSPAAGTCRIPPADCGLGSSHCSSWERASRGASAIT